ncbi:MAG: hypothetical protein AAGB93_13060 [Planctomycetota bacterium]
MDRTASLVLRATALAASALVTPLAYAQGLAPSLVTDTAGDTIWSCTDLDQNGDYNGAGEVAPFYSDTLGPVPLTNNAAILLSEDGALWITDTSEDIVLRLFDLDGNGNAEGPGEAVVWFDGTEGNASGVELTSGRGQWRDEDGVHWVASANTGGGGVDAIVRLEDVNGDGDANDAGEQLEYAVFAVGGSVGDSIPTAVARGADGALYYVETGSTGVFAKGVYRLEDLDGSGTIDQPNENTAFFLPSSLGGSPFHWDLGVDEDGRFYMNDTGNDVIWRFSDVNGDGTVDEATEADVVYDAPATSLIWEITPASDGSLYVVEDQNPDRLLRLVDLNGDGLFDGPGEEITIYDETVSPTNFGSPKGIVLLENLPIGTNECGPAVANSSGGPATASAIGSTSLAAQSVTLSATGLPTNSFSYFLTSTTPAFIANPGGSQGNLCLSGAVGRYAGNILNSGASGEVSLAIDVTSLPQPTGSVAAVVGETWRFQAWFRDANPNVTSNFSDAIAITFTP